VKSQREGRLEQAGARRAEIRVQAQNRLAGVAHRRTLERDGLPRSLYHAVGRGDTGPCFLNQQYLDALGFAHGGERRCRVKTRQCLARLAFLLGVVDSFGLLCFRRLGERRNRDHPEQKESPRP
jgi:hypothetical protein